MIFICVSWLSMATTIWAQGSTVSISEYIEQYKEIAIAEMGRTGIPASITLAQGILESTYGNSVLVKKSNNHFGIKCKKSWTGRKVQHDDDRPGEWFRAYDSAAHSFIDHSNFLKNGPRYAFLFDLDPYDYKGWAKGLKKAGYATNPKYAAQIINCIEKHKLQQYDLEIVTIDYRLFVPSQYPIDYQLFTTN